MSLFEVWLAFFPLRAMSQGLPLRHCLERTKGFPGYELWRRQWVNLNSVSANRQEGGDQKSNGAHFELDLGPCRRRVVAKEAEKGQTRETTPLRIALVRGN